MFLYTSEVILLLPLAVTSSIETTEAVLVPYEPKLKLYLDHFSQRRGGVLWIMNSSFLSG